VYLPNGMKSGEEQCYYTENDLNVVLEMSYFGALLLTFFVNSSWHF